MPAPESARFVRRYRVGVIVAAAVAASLLLGFGAGGWWAADGIGRLLFGGRG